ncbi:hypothetical protein T492DRAFT_864123, partial [Pavlovales sp. CCMP2436]
MIGLRAVVCPARRLGGQAGHGLWRSALSTFYSARRLSGQAASGQVDPEQGAPGLRLRSALSTEFSTERAVRACLDELQPAGASFLVVLLAGHSAQAALDEIAAYDPALVARTVGSSAYSLVHASRAPRGEADGSGAETETIGGSDAVSITAGWLPDTVVQPFAIEAPTLPDFTNVAELALAPAPPSFVLLATPLFRSAQMLRVLDAVFPTAPKVGLTAECADSQEDPEVFANGKVLTSGCVGFALSGDATIDVVASCGLRPITGGMATSFASIPGRAAYAGEADQIALATLEGKPAGDVLSQCEKIFGTNKLRLGAQLQTSLAGGGGAWVPLGVSRRAPDSGVPLSPLSEGVALAGARVAVCARDGVSSSLDLSVSLAKALPALSMARGALLFSTGSRGSSATRVGLFGHAGHDITALVRALDAAGAPCESVGGAHAGAPISAVEEAGRTHLLPESLVVALFRSRKESLAALLPAAEGQPAHPGQSAHPAGPRVFSMCERDRSSFGGTLDPTLAAALAAGVEALPGLIRGPGPARAEDARAHEEEDDEEDDDDEIEEVGDGKEASLDAAKPQQQATVTIVTSGAALTLPLFDLPSEVLFPTA